MPPNAARKVQDGGTSTRSRMSGLLKLDFRHHALVFVTQQVTME